MFKQPVAQLWRYDLNLATGAQTERCLSRRGFEFPSVNPAFAGCLPALHPCTVHPEGIGSDGCLQTLLLCSLWPLPRLPYIFFLAGHALVTNKMVETLLQIRSPFFARAAFVLTGY